MRKSRASKLFMSLLVLLIGATLFGTVYFFQELNSNYILINGGLEPEVRILYPYEYQQSQKGLIFSLTALIVTFCIMIMVILPDEEAATDKPAARAAAAKAKKQTGEPSTISAEVLREEPAHGTEPKREEFHRREKVEEVEQIETDAIEFEETTHEVTEGDDDVVYGTAEITNAAVIDFVNKFPDSALKFLFRKQLDGKPLTAEEEEIYRTWEKRGMNRGKVKAYVLTLMEWDNIPKDPLYDIWKKMRDHIFETIH